ncbi:MAG TPA: hypothetical protein VGX78_17230, partial [Pirellulales bacterium]|nr:hypothetical protein [Pirellulales bacterium]
VGVGEADGVLQRRVPATSPPVLAHRLIHHRDKLEGVWRAAPAALARHLIHHRDKLDGVLHLACAAGWCGP